MRAKKETILWRAAVITPDTTQSKKIELQIAKKNYEIECLRIELKYPTQPPPSKIGFETR